MSATHVSPVSGCFGTVFTWVSKVIRICFSFALLRLVIGLNKTHHFVIQAEVKLEPSVTHSHMFSCTLCQLHVFALSCDWCTGFCLVIGQSDNSLLQHWIENHSIWLICLSWKCKWQEWVYYLCYRCSHSSQCINGWYRWNYCKSAPCS